MDTLEKLSCFSSSCSFLQMFGWYSKCAWTGVTTSEETASFMLNLGMNLSVVFIPATKYQLMLFNIKMSYIFNYVKKIFVKIWTQNVILR